MFINFKDNAVPRYQGFAPFGQVTVGMDVVDKMNAQYRQKAEPIWDPVAKATHT